MQEERRKDSEAIERAEKNFRMLRSQIGDEIANVERRVGRLECEVESMQVTV